MSKIEQMEAELRKLSQTELRQIRALLDDRIEDELEFTPEFERAIQQSQRIWTKVELHVCASRRARERSDPDLLRQVRRSFF